MVNFVNHNCQAKGPTHWFRTTEWHFGRQNRSRFKGKFASTAIDHDHTRVDPSQLLIPRQVLISVFESSRSRPRKLRFDASVISSGVCVSILGSGRLPKRIRG